MTNDELFFFGILCSSENRLIKRFVVIVLIMFRSNCYRNFKNYLASESRQTGGTREKNNEEWEKNQNCPVDGQTSLMWIPRAKTISGEKTGRILMVRMIAEMCQKLLVSLEEWIIVKRRSYVGSKLERRKNLKKKILFVVIILMNDRLVFPPSLTSFESSNRLMTSLLTRNSEWDCRWRFLIGFKVIESSNDRTDSFDSPESVDL